MYLYKKVIFIETDKVIGIDVQQNNADKTDWEDNYKSSAVPVNELVIAETTFIVDNITWATFKTLVDTPYTWGDVKYIENSGRYEIYLTSSEPLI